MYFQLEMFACSQTSGGHPAADGNSSYGRWVTRLFFTRHGFNEKECVVWLVGMS